MCEGLTQPGTIGERGKMGTNKVWAQPKGLSLAGPFLSLTVVLEAGGTLLSVGEELTLPEGNVLI